MSLPAALTRPVLARYYAEGGSPVALAQEVLARIVAYADPALFLHQLPEAALLAQAEALMAAGPEGKPLYGIPFVVKDNIDVAGLPTTAACPGFAYTPSEHATAVARLIEAGALMLGKVNLDQFATGLNGTRSPYGTPRNAVVADRIPGGSSSGSATAVSAGFATFSLGTDTAGSGRVPAMCQNIVGLKSTVGATPSKGMVPACRSIDLISVFALTVEDAAEVLAVMAGPEPSDPYSRPPPPGWSPAPVPRASWRLAVPLEEQLLFDTPDDAALFDAALKRAEALGAVTHRVDIAPLLKVATRLYDGAWVAERTSALREVVTQRPEIMHPVTRSIVEGGLTRLTVDAFDDFHAVAEARVLARAIFAEADLLLVPTAPGVPTLAQLAAEPIAANSRLGTYTNFVNLCDLSGLAVPAGFRGDGVPFGVTLLAPAWEERRLGGLGAALYAAAGLPMGATGVATPPAPPAPGLLPGETALFCVGAHMQGLPLNWQVVEKGGRLLSEARTAPSYRFYDLGGRPGMVRVADGGAAIAGEVWALPTASIGALLAQVPAPLGFGRVTLEDGAIVTGFLCEAAGVEAAPEITAFGGWRAYKQQAA
ncbi:allophanate hydrolase [Acetobacteraceae bacterium H6797]|nr:allophanate hydrolase [Acetobacteraceae bacterium H6797]